MKKFYKAPDILRKVTVEMENPILAGSVVTKKTTIETAGQQVEQRSFTDTGFNQVWE